MLTLSSAETEFRGNVKGMTEFFWLGKFMGKMGFPLKNIDNVYRIVRTYMTRVPLSHAQERVQIMIQLACPSALDLRVRL